MGAECCTASSNNKHEIIAQKTDQTLDEQPNEQAKKQILQKQMEQTTLKTSFYGSAGVTCSKTMTAQKNTSIQNVIKDYKGTIINNNQPLEKIKQQPGEDQMSKIENPKGTKPKEQNHLQISTAQLIDQQTNFYMEGMTDNLKDSKKRF